jgi:hypothetical protein
MSRRTTLAALAAAAALLACSPALNWREIRVESTGLKAMFPCKPDRAARTVAMPGGPVNLQALACDAQGATFAVLFADRDPGAAAEFLSRWQAATLGGLHGSAAQERKLFRPAGALDLPQSLMLVVDGRRADGNAVQGQLAWFVHGRQVFQAVVYADKLRPEAVEPFFSGLAFE